MGEIYLELTVANIHDWERRQEITFLVDIGATRAWISKEPVSTTALELADAV